MDKIIAGSFDSSVKAGEAAQALLNAGFPQSDVSTYHNNAPGQHGFFPIGGDEDADPESKGAEKTALQAAVVGSVIGAGVGAAVAGPIGAVAGAGVGAYTGALGGALSKLGDEETTLPPARRPAGIMVAVKPQQDESADKVIALMREHGAVAIEEAEGEWKDGQWADFDPLAVPHVVWRDEAAASAKGQI
jgi:hypothetical protein